MAFTKTGRQIWRDYETDGVPSPDGYEPKKTEIRHWALEVETRFDLFGGFGSLIFPSRAAMLADLDHDDNTQAWVIGDPLFESYNGVWSKSGASGTGTWTRVGDLPYAVIPLTTTGGSENNILASSALPVPAADMGALLLLTPALDNTSSNVQVSINGAAHLPIRGQAGEVLLPGAVKGGSVMALFKLGGQLRTLNDFRTEVFAAQASADAASASTSASVAVTNATAATAAAAASVLAAEASGNIEFYDTKAAANAALAGLPANQIIEVFADESRGGETTRYRKQSGVYVYKLTLYRMGPTFQSRTAAAATAIPTPIVSIETLAYSTEGDRGGCVYARTGASSTGAFQSLDGAWWKPVSVVIRPEMFGAKGDNTTDDATACQTAVDLAFDRTLAGTGIYKVALSAMYYLGSPLRCFRLNGPSNFHYFTVSIEGEAGTSGYVDGRIVGFRTSNVNMPAIALNSGRECAFRNFRIMGPNGYVLPSYAQLVDDSAAPWWNAAGMRDTQFSPCAGIVVDPFKFGGAPADGGYPGWSSYYVENRGSSLTAFENVSISGYIVGIMLSPSGSTQNNDAVRIKDCRFLGNKVPIAVGQDQCRNVTVDGCFTLGAKCFCDGTTYGSQIGVMPNITNCLIDYTQYVLSFTSGRGSGILQNCFTESTLSIGYWGIGGFPLSIKDCHLKLIRADQSSVRSIDAVLTNAGPVIFDGGSVTYYSNTPVRAYINNAALVTFNGTAFDGLPIFRSLDMVELNGMPLRYMGAGASYGLRRSFTLTAATAGSGSYDVTLPPGGVLTDYHATFGVRNYTNNEGFIQDLIETSTVTTGANGTATFTAADPGSYAVGDTLCSFSTSTLEVGPGITQSVSGAAWPIGRITGIAGSVISLGGVPKALVTGSKTICHQRLGTFRRRSVGDITSGTNTITNVENISTWVAGNWIRGTGIPVGTRVVSKVGTTLTISRNATASGTDVPIFDARLSLTGTQNWAVGAPSSDVWFKDDALQAFNVGATQPDANNLIIDAYRCLASGVPGTWVTKYSKTTSP